MNINTIKKQSWKSYFLFMLACIMMFQLFSSVPVCAQEKTERALFFTYIGAVGGYGINKIEYSDWFDEQRENKDIDGSYYSGGLFLAVFVNAIVGELTIQYMGNSSSGDVDVSLQHVYVSTVGKIALSLGENFALAAGAGPYMETPPASKTYDGSGGIVGNAGFIITIGYDFKIIVDAVGRYGSFGMGEDSTKMSYGGKLGFVYSVGRI